MKQIFTHVLIFSIVLVFSCKDKSTNPPDDYPPGYQHDIPWPSLAYSPWPINHGNAQFNGRAIVVGPSLGELAWRSEFETTAPTDDSFLSPVIRDTVVYVVSYKDVGEASSHLFALSINNGTVIWKFPLVHYKNTSPPISNAEGTIYVADWGRNLYAINKNGELIWKIQLASPITSTMNIGKDGTLYAFAHDGIVYAFTKAGVIKWQTDLINDFGSSSSAIVFSPDGNTMYITGKKFTALSTDGKILWTLFDGAGNTWDTHPIVDYQGNIYIAGGDIKINSAGTEITYLTNNDEVTENIEPIIDKNGNIYLGLISGEILSLNYKGERNWKKPFNIRFATSIVSDKNSNIYFFSNDGYLNSIDSNGNILWRYFFDNLSFYSPALSDGRILFGSVGENGKYFYCIK